MFCRQSLSVLDHAKRLRPDLVTKSSIMLGLGETEQEIRQTMEGTDERAQREVATPLNRSLHVHTLHPLGRLITKLAWSFVCRVVATKLVCREVVCSCNTSTFNYTPFFFKSLGISHHFTSLGDQLPPKLVCREVVCSCNTSTFNYTPFFLQVLGHQPPFSLITE